MTSQLPSRLNMNALRSSHRGRGLEPIADDTQIAPPTDALLHSVPDAGRRLGVSVSTIWRMIRDQLIFATYVRRRTLIAEAELRRYIAGATAVSATTEAAPSNTESTSEFA